MITLWLLTGVLAAQGGIDPPEPPGPAIVGRGAIDYEAQRRRERKRREAIEAASRQFEVLEDSPIAAAAKNMVAPYRIGDSVDWARFVKREQNIRQLQALIDEIDDEQALLMLL